LTNAVTVATNHHNRVTLHHATQPVNTNIRVTHPINLNEFSSNYGRSVLNT